MFVRSVTFSVLESFRVLWLKSSWNDSNSRKYKLLSLTVVSCWKHICLFLCILHQNNTVVYVTKFQPEEVIMLLWPVNKDNWDFISITYSNFSQKRLENSFTEVKTQLSEQFFLLRSLINHLTSPQIYLVTSWRGQIHMLGTIWLKYQAINEYIK